VKAYNILKIVLIILLGISILSLFTPLTFTNVWVRNFWYISTVLLSVLVGLRMKQIQLKYILIYLPITFFLVLFLLTFNSLADRRTDMWRTSWISHRKGLRYVAAQMLDIGAKGYAKRTVIIIPLTPVFEWTSKVDTTNLDASWVRTVEGYNPYDLK
jgi:hypothetical protein